MYKRYSIGEGGLFTRIFSGKKPNLLFFLAALLFSSFLLGNIPALAQLTGTKVIGSGGDYTNFTTAVSALNSLGVGAGGVTFNVKSGSYNEHIRLGNISGASAGNPIIFQSQAGNKDSVTLYYAAPDPGNNYVVKLDSADYVTFQNMTLQATGTTYAIVFYLLNGADNISIKNNNLTGYSTGSSSANYTLIYSYFTSEDNTEISGNNFSNGGWSILMYGVSTAAQSVGTRVLNNTFNTGYGGVFLQHHNSPVIRGNTITANGNSGYGIYAYDCDDSLRIQKNKVNLPTNGNGIIAQYCDGTQFGGRGLIANNFATVGGTGGATGLQLDYCNYMNVYYNSVNQTNTHTSYYAFYLNSGGNISVRNNIFANNGGYAFYTNTPAAIANSNYNDLYTPGSYLAYWSGDRKDLAALKSASSTDTNSVFIYPQYVSSTDLHQASPWIDSAGTPSSLVTDDIDGQLRDASKPDLGADEFVAAPSTLTPLSGTYTVGSGGNYTTLNAAVNDVVLKGVSGPVTFDVIPGPYSERFLLVNVPGNSTTNTITFQSQTGIASDVSIFKDALNAGENYLVRLYGADNVIIQNLSFFATGTTYARVIELMGGVDNTKIMNNILTGYATGSSSGNYYLIFSDNYYTSNIQITGNNFSQGGWSIIMYGLSTTVPTLGTRVLNNTFSSGYGGVYLTAHKSAYVNSNFITVTGNSGFGIYAYDCDDSLQIQKNKVNLPTNGNGILAQYCDGTQFGGKGLIANNFVTVGGTGGASGLQLDYCNYMNVYYNSVNQTNTHTSYYAFYLNSGGNINVRNNIFANNGGYAYYTNTPAAIATSNYNDLYSPGNFLAYWSGNRKDLAAFKTASSKDTNSVFIYPQYFSSTDLHQASPWIDSAAAPISSVTQDIDGDARDAAKPDIGADEFVAAPASLTPLTGTLTIGSLSKSASPSANYSTLTEAVTDLVLRGVSGPVTFDIQPGNYNERMDLVSIPGSSSANTVTFQSQTGNRGEVIIYAEALNPGENYVVRLNGADHLIFKNLTFQAIGTSYARIFYLWGSTDNLKIQNNLLIGAPTTSSSPNYYLIHADYTYSSGTQITGNTFSQGGWGIIMYGLNANDVATGTRVLNDTFSTGYGGVYLNAHKSAYINSNVITVTGNSGFGTYVYDCDDSLQIQKNKVNLPTNGNGILLQYCDGTQLGVKGLTANNFVTVGGTGAADGIQLDYCNYQNVYYNSVNQTNTNTGYYAFYLNSGGNIKVKNNIFANNGGGYAYYINTPAAIDTSNYNDLYTPGSFLAYWAGNRKDLAALQLASGKDANSVFIYPQFVSATDLHQASPWLDSMATPIGGLGGVTQDIDGNSRDASKPDLGADEFVAAPSTLTPLSGIYTIGSTLAASPNADYPTLTDAVNDVVLKGVSGPVTFNIQTGTYNERVAIVSVPGAGTTNSVTFQSLSGNRNDVTIFKEALSPGENYVVKLYGADYIRFQKLKFQATGATYARIFDLVGGVDDAKIQNNLLIGYTTTSSSGNYTLINSDNYYITNTEITGNTFNQGGWGIFMYGLSNAVPTTGTRVLSDTFSTGYGGVYLNAHKSAYVNGNVITANGNSGFGIYTYDCDDSLQIQKNKVNLPTNGNGILLQYCDGTDLGGKGLTANNFVTVGGTGAAAGIQLDYCNYQNIYYNSVNQTNTHSSYYAFYANSGGNINVVDNIFVNLGGGYAYYVNPASAIVTSNYNDFYTTGPNLAYWSGNRADLLALQTASGKDINSISLNPKFFSASDLHVLEGQIDSTATSLALVSDDIDGDARDASRPDMGADEFTCVAIPGDVNATGNISLADIINVINYIFDKDKLPCLGINPGNCWTPVPFCRGDVNQSGTITLADVVNLINFVFDKDKLPCLGINPGNCWTPLPSPACCLPVP